MLPSTPGQASGWSGPYRAARRWLLLRRLVDAAVAENEPENVVEAGIGRAGHRGGSDLDQDHLDQELDACGEEVTGGRTPGRWLRC
jgi:hypothetical protein